ncbi:MAG: hypothetical protein M3130_09135 [Actinomycetota bacterium]|nr:hypothetical protein [Actinomycetota bacterium]
MVISAAANLTLIWTGNRPDIVLVSLVVVGVVTTAGLMIDGLGEAQSAAWSAQIEPERTDVREDDRLASYRRLVQSHLEAREVDDHLRARLLALAETRSWAKYGVLLREEPDRAQRLLGPAATELTSGGRPARLSPPQIAALISRIEEL